MFRGVLISVTNVEQVLCSGVLCLAAHRKSRSSQCCKRGEIQLCSRVPHFIPTLKQINGTREVSQTCLKLELIKCQNFAAA